MFAKKNNGRVLVNVGLILLVLAGAGFFAFRGLQGTARVKVVNRDTAVDAVTGSVLVSADGGYKEVKSELAGRVIDAQAINKGSHFKARDSLVQLDTSDIDRTIAETTRAFEAVQEREKIELESNQDEKLAKEAVATVTRLRDLGNASDEQVRIAQRTLDEVQRKFRVAAFDRKKREADYKVTMDTLAQTRDKMAIPAPPMDGEVKEPLTWEGALIGGGQPVAIVYSTKRIVAAKISEESFGKVKIGQKARLRLLTYGEQSFDAVVSKLLPTADEAQRFEVWLDVKVDNPEQLKPGSSGEVTITVAEREKQIVIPRRARFDGNKVFVVNGSRVELRTIEVGYDSALNVLEVRKGLNEGERVIVDNLDEFHDGQRVQVEVVK